MRRRVAAWADLPSRTLDYDPHILDLEHTLDCGQTFRWRRQGDAWVGVVGRRIFRLSAGSFQAWPDEAAAANELRAYLRLDVDLAAVQAELRERDRRVGEAIDAYPGLRVLAQPPQETLLTFVCSPASNIIRITRSVALLCRLYGEEIAEIEGEQHFAFPAPSRLAATEPGELMARTGLGFRGENLRRVCEELTARAPDWPAQLAADAYATARAQLTQLPGVGPKIADCVCLFGLRFDEAVPVDTHVEAIGRELFGPEVKGYERVLAAYQARFGRWAGWAQQYLYHGRRVARELPMPSEVRLARA